MQFQYQFSTGRAAAALLPLALSHTPLLLKHTLLPVWLLTYTYGSKNYQVAVNGATGKIAGEYPLSWVKIAIAIVLGLILLAIFIHYSE